MKMNYLMTYRTVNKAWLIAVLLGILWPLQIVAQDIPEPMGFVNDYKGILSESQRQQLDHYLSGKPYRESPGGQRR